MNFIVTGASRGIGLELVAQGLAKGGQALAVARAPEESSELQALAKKHGKSLEIAKVDLDDPQAPAKIAAAVAAWGEVDLVINNAGVYKEGVTMEDFLESFRINSVTPVLVTRALFPKLRKAKQPRSVQLTSRMGSIADNTSGGSYAYRASKAALNMINKTLAIDEKWLLTAVLHPGWVQTRMGGEGAPTPTRESAAGIWRVIEGLNTGSSGQFFDFEGDHLPW